MRNKMKDLTNVLKYKIKINTLENKIETLEHDLDVLQNIVKEELYDQFMSYIKDVEKYDKLKKENKALKEKNKTLKDMIKKGLEN